MARWVEPRELKQKKFFQRVLNSWDYGLRVDGRPCPERRLNGWGVMKARQSRQKRQMKTKPRSSNAQYSIQKYPEKIQKSLRYILFLNQSDHASRSFAYTHRPTASRSVARIWGFCMGISWGYIDFRSIFMNYYIGLYSRSGLIWGAEPWNTKYSHNCV